MMTVICKDCAFQYGRWRPQCPTCGTNNPNVDVYTTGVGGPSGTPVRAARERAPRAPKRARLACIVCRKGGARKLRCPHCDERIHKACLVMHADDCAAFQLEREAACRRIGVTP